LGLDSTICELAAGPAPLLRDLERRFAEALDGAAHPIARHRELVMMPLPYHEVMSEDVEVLLRRLIAGAERDPDVLAIILFGSRARADAGPRSDVDVCLVLDLGVPSGLPASRKRLGYLTSGDVDLTIFQQLPLYIRSRILKEGRVVFVRDEDRLYDLAVRTARSFEGFRHRYRRYLDAVARD
jgi:predicted nucleotidyltransferase